MKYKVRRSGQFKKSFKLALKRGKDPELFKTAVGILANTGALPESYLPHRFHGNRKEYGNVILSQTGCCCGSNMTTSLC